MQFCLPLYIQHSMPSTQKALCKCSLSEQARWSARGHIYAWEQVVEKCSFSTTTFLPFCSFKSNDLKCILKPSQGANTVSVQFSRSVLSDSLWPHGLQHTRLPCASPTPRACSNSCPSNRWWHPTISSSVISFSSCLQSFSASGSFPMSQFFASGGQSIGASAPASGLSMNIQDWFPLRLTGWISLQSKGLSRVFFNTTVQKHQFFGTQPSLRPNSHIHTWLLTVWNLIIGKKSTENIGSVPYVLQRIPKFVPLILLPLSCPSSLPLSTGNHILFSMSVKSASFLLS